jgi:hypothetical protein
MKGTRFSEEQIIGVLREQEAGARTEEVCRRHGISSLAEARAIIEAWRNDYNDLRPHSSLGALTPNEFAALYNWREIGVLRPLALVAVYGPMRIAINGWRLSTVNFGLIYGPESTTLVGARIDAASLPTNETRCPPGNRSLDRQSQQPLQALWSNVEIRLYFAVHHQVLGHQISGKN